MHTMCIDSVSRDDMNILVDCIEDGHRGLVRVAAYQDFVDGTTWTRQTIASIVLVHQRARRHVSNSAPFVGPHDDHNLGHDLARRMIRLLGCLAGR
jgi:hypothetical protein